MSTFPTPIPSTEDTEQPCEQQDGFLELETVSHMGDDDIMRIVDLFLQTHSCKTDRRRQRKSINRLVDWLGLRPHSNLAKTIRHCFRGRDISRKVVYR